MKQATSDHLPTGNWYLFIGDGICLKVSSDLLLGEDEEGLVVLNPKQADQGLLKLRRDEAGRLLLKNASKRHVLEWRKGTATMVGSEFSLVAGSRIMLPNNELYLNHEMQRGQVSAHIVVQESEPAAEQLEVLVEVMPEALYRPMVVSEAEVDGQEADAQTDVEPAATPLSRTDAASETVMVEKLLDREVFAEPLLPVRSSTPQIKDDSNRGNHQIVLIGVAVVACLVIGMLLGNWYTSSDSTVSDASSVQPQLLESTPALLTSAGDTSPGDPSPGDPSPGDTSPGETLPGVTTPSDTTLPETAVAQPSVAEAEVAAALARASAYMAQGFITQPRDGNAVLELSNILWQDPSNQAAFELMGEATNRLIDAAIEAHSAGFEYEARNLIEEVLGFNPQHPQANAYKRQWARNDTVD
ncbi:MAG: hypothetical protein ACFHXK_18285 [bacterium]